jgi:hypothetical protein
MTTSSLEKRLAVVEARLAWRGTPRLVNCWTPSLARRISAALPPAANIHCVALSFSSVDAEEEFEAGLRADNPQEAAKLDALLRGEVP